MSVPKTPKTETSEEPIEEEDEGSDIDVTPEAEIPGRPSTDDDREA